MVYDVETFDVLYGVLLYTFNLFGGMHDNNLYLFPGIRFNRLKLIYLDEWRGGEAISSNKTEMQYCVM